MRWPEVVEVIKAQQSEVVNFSELDWNAKCNVLRINYVTAMHVCLAKPMNWRIYFIMVNARPEGVRTSTR